MANLRAHTPPTTKHNNRLSMNHIKYLTQQLYDHDLWDKTITLSRNEFLVMEGSVNTHLYYVESGSLRVFINHEKEEHNIRFGYTGSFISALDSFITDQQTDFYIQAIKKTTIKAISKPHFLAFVNQSLDHLQLWQQIMGMLILQQLEREKDLLTTSPQARYQRVFKRSPQLFQAIPHKHIASYLRMTPETLSRLKKKL